MDFYFGGIGKGNSWGLLSETPFVVFLEKTNEFMALKTIEEAQKHEGTDNMIYVWNNGVWSESKFFAMTARPSSAIGFNQ